MQQHKPFLTRKQLIVLGIIVLVLLIGRTFGGSSDTSPSHSDTCSQAQTKSSDPYVSDHDADRAIADCIDSLGH